MPNLEFYKDLLYQFENRKRNCSDAEYVHESIIQVVKEMEKELYVSISSTPKAEKFAVS